MERSAGGRRIAGGPLPLRAAWGRLWALARISTTATGASAGGSAAHHGPGWPLGCARPPTPLAARSAAALRPPTRAPATRSPARSLPAGRSPTRPGQARPPGRGPGLDRVRLVDPPSPPCCLFPMAAPRRCRMGPGGSALEVLAGSGQRVGGPLAALLFLHSGRGLAFRCGVMGSPPDPRARRIKKRSRAKYPPSPSGMTSLAYFDGSLLCGLLQLVLPPRRRRGRTYSRASAAHACAWVRVQGRSGARGRARPNKVLVLAGSRERVRTGTREGVC